ncbi:hypothetical protein [Marinifilum caeruleilacunae]|uniref:DUF3137 domain-containing protein n=1 Tax=Marinifilum caeruleilacunae TaxID=2499076 RepID=A0ABX1WXG3_9BACT|nr:hypothetical protein [Marinifilum caeruleilacunae]NOU60823.1 hypothetical protein [Marinifilum caeruleilacunae]
MKIKVGNWKVDSRTLIRLEWRKYYPKLIIQEKFEKHIKWILRGLALLGILISFFVLPYHVGIIVTIVLFAIQTLIEKALFEYSVMIVQPFPDFKIDYDQWVTNGYFITNEEVEGYENYPNYFGPAYKDENYAYNFFSYIREWNQNSDTDFDNNICISFIYEDDVSYSTYLYANPDRKWLDESFNSEKDKMKLEKYGKEQQSMVIQMVYWKNLKMTNGMFFTQFIESQKKREKKEFYFAPFIHKNGKIGYIDELKVLKVDFKVKGRSELTENEVEYHHR